MATVEFLHHLIKPSCNKPFAIKKCFNIHSDHNYTIQYKVYAIHWIGPFKQLFQKYKILQLLLAGLHLQPIALMIKITRISELKKQLIGLYLFQLTRAFETSDFPPILSSKIIF